ncbi:MAG: DUF1778 domain-containing protein [Planctomycetes bacterium]|nr:DUF1778 domain-containing protein [Planctomycetota bacterium]
MADKKGRVSLPGFANATVILESVSATEYRVRKAEVIPQDELHFPEEDVPWKLTRRDAAKVLAAIDNPPRANAALRRAAKRFKKSHG